MKGTMQRLTLLGRLGSDPDCKEGKNEQWLAKFSVATTDRVKRKGRDEWEDLTTWHKVTAFGQLATFSRDYLKKGDSVYIEGKLRPSTWEDSEGKEHHTIDIIASQLQQVGRHYTDPKERSSATSVANDDDHPLKDIE